MCTNSSLRRTGILELDGIAFGIKRAERKVQEVGLANVRRRLLVHDNTRDAARGKSEHDELTRRRTPRTQYSPTRKTTAVPTDGTHTDVPLSQRAAKSALEMTVTARDTGRPGVGGVKGDTGTSL